MLFVITLPTVEFRNFGKTPSICPETLPNRKKAKFSPVWGEYQQLGLKRPISGIEKLGTPNQKLAAAEKQRPTRDHTGSELPQFPM